MMQEKLKGTTKRKEKKERRGVKRKG